MVTFTLGGTVVHRLGQRMVIEAVLKEGRASMVWFDPYGQVHRKTYGLMEANEFTWYVDTP